MRQGGRWGEREGAGEGEGGREGWEGGAGREEEGYGWVVGGWDCQGESGVEAAGGAIYSTLTHGE